MLYLFTFGLLTAEAYFYSVKYINFGSFSAVLSLSLQSRSFVFSEYTKFIDVHLFDRWHVLMQLIFSFFFVLCLVQFSLHCYRELDHGSYAKETERDGERERF